MAYRMSAVLLLAIGACGPNAPAKPPASVTDQLASLLDSTWARSSQVPGLMLRVESPALAEPWSRAVGLFDRATREPLLPTHSVRTASQTKTFVATAVLRLMEQGKVGLDSAMARYLAPESIEQLRRGGYDPTRITVRHLLTHTSGIFDYGMTREYLGAIRDNPGHRWSRLEQVRFAIDHGNPQGQPGESYHYSDTGYVLLGELLERIQGKPLGEAVRELVGFERLGIRHTYFETLDSVPPGTGPRAHQYMDTVDTYHMDASHDLWGGGGLVSTLEDLARFFRALVRGEVFERRETADTMLVATPASKNRYGMGIERATIGDLTCYGHSGFWGTMARYCPAIDLTAVASMNRTPDSAYVVNALVEQAVRRMRLSGNETGRITLDEPQANR